MRILFLLFAFFFLVPFTGIAQENNDAVFQIDSIGESKNTRIIGLPIAFYTPETNFGFGGGAQVYLLNRSNIYNERLSNILVSGIYTLNEQIMIDIKPQLYLSGGDFFFDMSYQFKIFPNSFWGIGPNTTKEMEESYGMTTHALKIAFLKRIPTTLNFGFEYVFEYHNVTSTEENGLLDGDGITGNDQATISGIGVVFNLDSRDNLASPKGGHFLQANARVSGHNFGATQPYNKFITDLRTYRPIGGKSVFAIQLYSENTYGDAPFQGMAWFGGGERGRGYFKGRYIDYHMLVLQAEYRLRFHPRWIVAGFALMGNVADVPENLNDNIKSSAGGGFRFKLVKDQDILLRLDIGVNKEGDTGLYFGVNEAF